MSRLNIHQEHMLECAVNYATQRGWYVIPVSKNKIPVIKNWSEEASNDEMQIVKWWLKHPAANIGILTGPESGFWVVDTDNRKEYNGLLNLQNYFGSKFTFNVQKHLAGKTPTGGVHLLFEWNDDFPVKTTSKLLEGVDVRGKGGQIIVAPSSRNIDGDWREYRWNDWDNEISPMLPWTYDLLDLGQRHGQLHKLDVKRVVTGVQEGDRDESINRFAWLLRTRNIDESIAVGFVKHAADLCEPSFDRDVAIEKVRRAYATPFEPTTKEQEINESFDFEKEMHNRIAGISSNKN